jgi:hypothetical protein
MADFSIMTDVRQKSAIATLLCAPVLTGLLSCECPAIPTAVTQQMYSTTGITTKITTVKSLVYM